MKAKDLAHVAHYGASIFLIGIAVLTMFGVHFPGVTVDTNTAIVTGLAGLGIGGAGLKADLA